MKMCTKCNNVLPDVMFNKSSRNKNGLRAECRQCQSDVSKGYPGPAKPRSQNKTQYIKKRVRGVNVPLHRAIMEKFIGRSLLPNEIVHHINGDRYDNRIENLEIVSPGDHSKLHNKGRKHSDETKGKVSKSLIGNKRRTGILHTPEVKAQIAQSMREARKKRFWSTRKK